MTTVAEHAEKDTLRTETANDSDAGATVGAAIATVRGEYVDRNNDGVCDNYGVGKGANGQGSCAGYADADGDGIVDSFRFELSQQLVGFETVALPLGSPSARPRRPASAP